jgi:hypothetical protein
MQRVIADKGRAKSARPLSCLFIVAVALLAPSVARAETPITPRLTATNPLSSEASPATTTAPLVAGEGEPQGGVIIQGTKQPSLVVNAFAGTFAGKPTHNPTFEILIFDEAECHGSVVGTGDAEEFEEAGILVTVAPDAVTILSAKQIDPNDRANPSGCSGPFQYWEGNVPSSGGAGAGGSGSSDGSSGSEGAVGQAVTTGRPEAPHIHISPKATANDNTPEVVGSAPGAGSVLVFANSSCTGSPVASGPASQLASGFVVQVADNTTTTFSAVSVGGQRSNCSSPVTYVEDSTSPRIRVTMGPGVKTRKRKAIFRFTDVVPDPPGTSFFCKVDRRKWKSCSSPFRLGHLKPSKYVVRFRAVDLAGNVQRAAVKRIFKVVPHS